MHSSFAWMGSLLLLSSSAFAAPVSLHLEQPVARGSFAVGVGSQVTFELPNENQERTGIFLGRLLGQDGTPTRAMLLDESSREIYYAPASEIQGWNEGFEPVLKPYPQEGGTCTGYAIDHFMVQMNFDGFRGNGELAARLATEEGRSSLLVDAINQYYLVLQHRFSIQGILNGYGKDFGFHCRTEKFTAVEKMRARILEKLATGLPVMISFDVGTQMTTPRLTLNELDQDGNKTELDPRLWIPRVRSERSGGGHSIVAVAAFQLKRRTKLLVLDSDWGEPRVWDLDKYISDKTAVDEIEILSCSEAPEGT